MTDTPPRLLTLPDGWRYGLYIEGPDGALISIDPLPEDAGAGDAYQTATNIGGNDRHSESPSLRAALLNAVEGVRRYADWKQRQAAVEEAGQGILGWFGEPAETPSEEG